MILEVAILQVRPGMNHRFETDFQTASDYLQTINGYKGHSLQKCVEHDQKYILLVRWNQLEDHTIGFRQSKEYQKWKDLLHHYYDPFPTVEHYEMVSNFTFR